MLYLSYHCPIALFITPLCSILSQLPPGSTMQSGSSLIANGAQAPPPYDTSVPPVLPPPGSAHAATVRQHHGASAPPLQPWSPPAPSHPHLQPQPPSQHGLSASIADPGMSMQQPAQPQYNASLPRHQAVQQLADARAPMQIPPVEAWTAAQPSSISHAGHQQEAARVHHNPPHSAAGPEMVQIQGDAHATAAQANPRPSPLPLIMLPGPAPVCND